MDILSKSVLALIEDENLRKALEELLSQTDNPSSTVKLKRPKSKADSSTADESEVVTLRRLSA